MKFNFDMREWDSLSHKRGQYDYVTYSLMLMPFTLHYIHKTAIASFNVIELPTALVRTPNTELLRLYLYGKKEKKMYIREMGWRLIFEIASILLIDKYCDIYTI